MNSVKIISGANEQTVELIPDQTLTVGQIRTKLRDVLGIAENATAVIDGSNVTDDRVLAGSDTLEFIKDSGTKG
ncbi:hypothetical protein KAZ92_03060 [Candidatus Gracilibacteria bacterium]|nr:hypothetical protein [Candidatus Gracilibacteria bacterium]